MRYFLNRGGTRYGPYSPEEIRRYLVSGNIALTDRLEPEDGGEPVSAAQFSDSQTSGVGAPSPMLSSGADPASPAHAAYTGHAAAQQPTGVLGNELGSRAYPSPSAVPAQISTLPALDWWLVLILSVVTCTLFGYIWAIVQSRWVKKIDPGSRATLYLLLPLLAIPIMVAMIAGGTIMSHVIGWREQSVDLLVMIFGVLVALGAAVASIAAFVSMSNSLSIATAHWGYARIDLGGTFVALTIVGWLTNLLFLIAPVWIQYQFDRARQMAVSQGAPAC
ncbi:MAG: hypothetical protein LC114_27875 [Bryobacterales bacterium]|nr:hypothetical protein [Bryobacterales bacterium]